MLPSTIFWLSSAVAVSRLLDVTFGRSPRVTTTAKRPSGVNTCVPLTLLPKGSVVLSPCWYVTETMFQAPTRFLSSCADARPGMAKASSASAAATRANILVMVSSLQPRNRHCRGPFGPVLGRVAPEHEHSRARGRHYHVS